MGIKGKAEFWKFKRTWRKKNNHNETVPVSIFPMGVVTVGKHSYGGLNVLAFNEINKLKIGNYVSIGPESVFILSADHYQNHISTYPFKAKIVTGENEGISKGDIIIEDDVWIGFRVTILSGVKVGRGSIISAGSVVTRDVEPYSVVAGIPGRKIKKRFSQDVIDYLMSVDFSRLEDGQIENHIDDLYTDIGNVGLKEVKEMYSWLPKV